MAEEYDVQTIMGEQKAIEEMDSKVWLITWNRNNWDWDNFEEVCEATKSGQTFVESWACANSNLKIGDEVFLIKLGEQPRGLIGHGKVKRAQYEKEHYDPVKASEGKNEKAIDVEFDRVINYEKDKFVEQSELIEKCGGQHWSPQSSGIEIKQEVLPSLRLLWEVVVREHKTYGFNDIVSFLDKHSGEHYTVPKKAGGNADYMVKLKRNGQLVREYFIEFGIRNSAWHCYSAFFHTGDDICLCDLPQHVSE